MSGLGFERTTQDRVLKLFQEQLGYRYLGDWKPQVGSITGSGGWVCRATGFLCRRCAAAGASATPPRATSASTPSCSMTGCWYQLLQLFKPESILQKTADGHGLLMLAAEGITPCESTAFFSLG